jgi:hypothetical protein
MQIPRRSRDWDDTRLSPRPTRHIDEQHPTGKLVSRRTNAVNQSQPWRQAEARDTSRDSESEESDFQRDCHHEHRSVAEFVRERVPAENCFRRATSSGRGTSTWSTRLTVPNNRVAARPWGAHANNAWHQGDNNQGFLWPSGSRNSVVADVTPTQVKQDNDYGPSSDHEDSDDLGDGGDRVVLDQIDGRDSRTRCRLVLGKRKAVDASPRNDFDRCGLIGVAASAKAKVKQHRKVCMVGDCKTWVRSKGVCTAHGGGKRCRYPEGCGKSALGRTMLCIAHGGGKRCQYPDGCGKSAIGRTMLCIAHGGGKRCQYPDGCDKSAIGRTMLCKAHGGGKRCIHRSGCNKHVVKRGVCKQHGVAAGVWT